MAKKGGDSARSLFGQFRLHLMACVLLVGVPFWSQAGIAAGGILLVLSAAVLWINPGSAARRFAGHGDRLP